LSSVFWDSAFGLGASGIVGTPLFGRGASGIVGTPLAKDIAKLVAATAMTVITIERKRFEVRDILGTPFPRREEC
jgi:hypothetical protein